MTSASCFRAPGARLRGHMGAGRSALALPDGEGAVHSPRGRETEAASLRRCAALDASWPGFVDAFVGACHAQGPAAPPPPPSARGVPPAVSRAVRPAAERLVAIGDLHGAPRPRCTPAASSASRQRSSTREARGAAVLLRASSANPQRRIAQATTPKRWLRCAWAAWWTRRSGGRAGARWRCRWVTSWTAGLTRCASSFCWSA